MAALEDSQSLIQNYEQLATLSAQMLDAARLEQWEQLVSLEQARSDLLTLIKPLDVEVALDAASKQRKAGLIQKILADDAEIRTHTQAWLGELQNIMNSVHHEQRLKDAYGD
jgi:flagellar protein FliT